MPWSGDTQEYLDELYAKRRKYVGIQSSNFSDQGLAIDMDALNAEIARVERVLALKTTGSTTRYASTSKGC